MNVGLNVRLRGGSPASSRQLSPLSLGAPASSPFIFPTSMETVRGIDFGF